MQPLPRWVGFVTGLTSTALASSVSVGLVPAGTVAAKVCVVVLALCTWVAVYTKSALATGATTTTTLTVETPPPPAQPRLE